MKLKEWLSKWHLDSLKFNAGFLELELNFKESDRKAAWELYIELITRSSTQEITDRNGVEQRALESIYELFSITRQIIKDNGRDCFEFTKIAVVILNQVLRPFTTKWHRFTNENAFNDLKKRKKFRKELIVIQNTLRNYSNLLAAMAGVEDLTGLK